MSQENRLSELYLGEFGEPTEQQRCKDRINWLCKQVRGPRVLDVGCSQGMASLLVARAGHDVTGIDIEAKPLQFARGLLRAEPRSVRARVTFETVDATQMPYEDGSYESAILGGILEYLAEPEAVLREVARVVEPLGTIAITAPLGLDPLPGSQRSFFLTSFLDLTESRFTVVEIKFAHGTLFAKVENAPSEAPLHSDPAQFAQLVRDFERECLKHQEEERRLLGQWSERYVELQQAKQALEADHESLRSDTTREAATQVEQIQSLETRAEQQESRADSLAAQFQQAETEVRQLSNQLTISQTALAEQQDLNRSSGESISQLTHELSEERAQRQSVGELLSTQQEEGAEFRTMVVRLEADLRSASDRVMVVEKDIGEHKAASASMRANADDLQAKFHEASNALLVSERDLERLRTVNETLSESLTARETERDQLRLAHSEALGNLRTESETKRALAKDSIRIEQERESLRDEMSRLEQEFGMERKLFREASEEHQGLQVESAVLRSENLALREVSDQRHTLNDSTEERILRLTEEFSESKKFLGTLQQNRDDKIKLGERELRTLALRLEQADSAWMRQRETLEASLAQARTLKNQLAQIHQELDAAHPRTPADAELHRSIEREREEIGERLGAAESANEALRARHAVDLLNLERKAVEADRNADLQRQQLASLETQCHTRTEMVTSLETRVREMEGEREQLEADLSEQHGYADRLQTLFKKEQADHQKVYESLKRYTEAWEERGQQLVLATTVGRERDRRLGAAEAELMSVKGAISFRVVARINRVLRGLRLRKPARAVWPPVEPEQPETRSIDGPIAASPNLETRAPAKTSEARSPNKTRTAAILDEFSMACFAPDCAIQTFRADNWRERLETEKPDLLLVESAWHGNDDSWQYRIASYEKNMGDELQDLIGWCREQSVPTVFWNKEDPVHYDRFIDSAKLFDVVLTSDARCVEQYQQEIGHARVHALPFAAQPRIHNPLRSGPRTGDVCFAGSYYANRFEQRREDMDNILKPALEFGLDIYDRNHGLVIPGTDHFHFPDIYQPAIRGRLEYDEMVEAYRRYRVFLNVNSVKNSRTMFSRRVFELLACGTPVISTPSIGISELLGDELVVRANSEDETRRALETLLQDQEEWARKSALGIRKVLTEHTYKVRFEAVRKFAGLGAADTETERVVCIARPDSKQELDALVETTLRQSRRPDELLILSDAGMKSRWIRPCLESLRQQGVEARSLDQTQFRETMQACNPSQILCFMSCSDAYGSHYLADHIQAFAFSPTPVLGKASFFSQSGSATTPTLTRPDEEHHLVNSVPSATVCARREGLEPTQIEELAYAGLRTFEHPEIYSGTRFNFCQTSSGSRPGKLAGDIEKKIFI